MRLHEFDIIKAYFKNLTHARKDVVLGVGDDCALLQPPKNQLLAVSMDTLISGVHFPKDLSPYETAYKALAVNLSDLAAMGAEPAWFTCALTLSSEQHHPDWLKNFSQGLSDLAKKYRIQLIGGDLTRGSILSITLQVHGFVPEKAVLTRSGAQIGDDIYISGELGHAVLHQYYYRPEPRVELGLALRNKAHAAIDISDGLLADLSHILDSSQMGASIYLDQIPLVHPEGLTAGDDYELCFILPEQNKKKFNIKNNPIKISCIGKIESASGLRIYLSEKNKILYTPEKSGYQHF